VTLDKLRFVSRDPDKAYIDTMLWLPKKGIQQRSVKEALQFLVVGDNGVSYLESMWTDSKHHLIVPREFIHPSQYPQYPFPFIDLSRRKYEKTKITVTVLPRDEKQVSALDAFLVAQNGVLNLAPGKGKTVLALLKAAQMGGPALIIVHNTYLLEQWKERIGQFVTFDAGEKLGVIQGQEFEWQHPIALAMINTLAIRAKDGRLPPEFFRWYAGVFWDEVHHLSAPLFNVTAPLFPCHRFGLTATPDREDGLQFVYHHHIGPIFYSDMEMEVAPLVYFQQTPTWVDLGSPDVKDKSGQLNISKLRSTVGKDPDGNRFRRRCIEEALTKGSKILCISHSKDQLYDMQSFFPGSGLIVQETPQKDRTEVVRKSQITFAIARLGVEGLDDDAIDVLMFLTPFKSSTDLKQSLGRITQRQKRVAGQSKKNAIAIFFEDVKIRPFVGLCNKLRGQLADMGLGYQTLKAPTNF